MVAGAHHKQGMGQKEAAVGQVVGAGEGRAHGTHAHGTHLSS